MTYYLSYIKIPVRSMLLVSLMAFLMTSCHKDDDLEQPDTKQFPISIGGGVQADMKETVTRADAYPLENDYKSFKVWCYKTMGYSEPNYIDYQNVMDQYIVQWTENTAGSTASNTSNWEYVGILNEYAAGPGGKQTMKYWDFYATSYRYFGFAPKDESKVEYGESGNKQPNKDGSNNWWYNISFDADATKPQDAPLVSKLWFANSATMGNHKYRDQVVMEFVKPVSKVRIRLIDAEGKTVIPQNEGFTELEFKPAEGTQGIVQSGKLKVSYALTGPATVANYLPQVKIVGTDVGTVRINKINDTYGDWYYVLPHVEQGNYQLVGKIGTSQRMATVPKEYMSWFPNMEYTYIFKMTDHDFQFIDIVQIGVTEWQTESSTHDIYNW